MPIIIIIVLLLVLLIWGIDSGLQNVAQARQAQATIETARSAQIASIGNLVVILLVALLIIVALAAIGFMLYRKTGKKPVAVATAPAQLPGALPAAGSASIDRMMQLMTLKVMMDLTGAQQKPARTELLEAPKDDDPITWR